MRVSSAAALVVTLGLCVFQLGSQSLQPSITFTSFPTWGQDGPITGNISGTTTQPIAAYVFAFIPDMGWYSIAGPCSQFPIYAQAGQFTINATPGILFRYATRFSAYVLPASISLGCGNSGATVPFIIQHDAIASVTYARIPQYSTINFAGLDWYVKDAPLPVFPGPQFFLKDNAFVDSQGQLHLKITPCGGSWCAAEIFTRQSVGYGTYTFNINSRLDTVDPNVTLGLFSWDGQAGDQFNREWDIEFSRWGNAASPANAQYVVQPYYGPNNIQHFAIGPLTPSQHVVSWSPSQVSFASSSGASAISQWSFPGPQIAIPTPGDVHLHLNFYINSGKAPSVPVPQEIVISSLQYVPVTAQIGFSRTADAANSQGQIYSVPLNGSAGCTATVDTDSPWLSVAPATIAAGSPVQYAVTSNLGTTRTGNLILQSTTCNATLGAQVLTVTQAGLVNQPAPVLVVPPWGAGYSQTMTFVFADPNGYQDLDVENVLINSSLDGRNACYIAYSRAAGAVYLVGDAGSGLSPGLVLNGSGGAIGNMQCTIFSAGSSVMGAGNTLTLILNIAFSPTFGGNQIVYTAARNLAGDNSGWQPLGVWQVPGPPPTTTTAVMGMIPGQGVGLATSTTLAFQFADAKGVLDLGVQNILLNDSLDGRHACYLAYARPTNTLYLVNDTGDALLPGKNLGIPALLSNGQCTILWGNNPVSVSGNTLTLSLSFAFSPAFAGNRIFYLASRDLSDTNNTGWQAVGTWAVR